ncbi:MAG: ABC transporter substrate-binding protein [Bacillota bacterium]|nr:ABC transporter substrate-binding protein [Bacillota bacterium]
MKKLLSLLMAALLVLGLVASVSAEGDAEVSYTYRVSQGASPINWNPHAWQMSNENDLMGYIEAPLVDLTIAEDGVNFAWTYEMADAVTDITATFADKAAWGIPEDATERRVYQIDLNPHGKWANGEAITADDYIYSMQQLLNPEMKNYRSNTYTAGESELQGAMGYFNNDKVGENIYTPVATDAGYAEVADADMLINVDEAVYFFGGLMGDYYNHDSYKAMFMSEDGTDLYAKIKGEGGYVPMTDEFKADLLTIAAAFGDTNPEAYKEFVFYVSGQYEQTPWEKVGLLKTGDLQLVYITAKPVSMFYFLTHCTGNWIVYKDLYEAGKEQTEKLITTNYGTSVETYMSTGPYKLVSFEKDKQMVLERNENWLGNFDGRHEGQYKATKVVIDVIAEPATALLLFNQGKLDSVDLQSDDLTTYRMSDRLQQTDETYTARWIFATSLDTLKALEEEANDGANKKVLHYRDFRKAISLAMDRTTFVSQATAGFKPAYYLFNYLYYTDIENDPNSQYRNSVEAKEAVLKLYGIEYGEGKEYADVDSAYAAVTGYDVEEARALFQSVYEKALADGNYTEGQAININARVSAAETMSPDDTKQQDLLNQMVAEATKGTGFEGKITFTFAAGAKTRYDDVATGKIEMIRGAWGGAAFFPFRTIQVYTDPDEMGGLEKIHESNGWNPTVETLTIKYDFNGDGVEEEVTKTFQEWTKSMNGAGEFAGDGEGMIDIRKVILSNEEAGVLAAYQCIPWGTYTVCSLNSYKIEPATEDYNIMYGYGGLRLMDFKYDDAAWDAYVAEQGGTLNYE